MTHKEEFISIVNANIKREGIEPLMTWLEKKSDFFTAPASTRFHLSYEGGLLEHSLNVYHRLKKEVETEYGDKSPYSDETIAIVALFHDLCKTNFYTIEYRNKKNEETGKWESVPFYAVDDKLPFGHGEKSQYIISSFMKLTREESMAIRWHMGAFDESVRGGSYSLNTAYEMFPLALLINMADMKATYLDENEKK